MSQQEIKSFVQSLFLYYYEKPGDTQHLDIATNLILAGHLSFDTAPLYIESLYVTFPSIYSLKNRTPEHILQKYKQQQNQLPPHIQLQIQQHHSIQSGGQHPQQPQPQPQQHKITPTTSPLKQTTPTSSSTTAQRFRYYDEDKHQFDKEAIRTNITNDTARQFVNELYTVLIGRLGDPASTNYLVTSLLDGSLTPQQAEFHVRFSKEAKQHAVVLKQREDKRAKAEEYVFELYRVYCGEDYICSAEEVLGFVKRILDTPNVDYQAIEDEIKLKAIGNVKVPGNKPFNKYL
ncbi:hypothetical protein SAMD00019534_102050 [Acytostelium subglobosum LB1]|uniref:hypothetical protein n=1 Tax=Acytostelium subglobosum LB1 TaxID=1410327 RepID=UPI000644B323|nr:hypothetical protein SAMD00019534_102050 [Acytostelium subglobosum LB1]GAM27030.1 hypothetical protein SAMD00019534_102050 [Acytostelium subglobosum LB1]|eukprot:XP_012749910.1 hypothetical protein SAMD00019534_102050 [Acytostelium subglobosum LB1]